MAVVSCTALLACSGKRDAPKIALAQASAPDSARAMEAAHAILSRDAKAALDSGNVLFRKKNYAGALAEYRVASSLAPQHAAPLFGIYMVGKATSNTAMADSALAQIQLRNGPMARAASHKTT